MTIGLDFGKSILFASNSEKVDCSTWANKLELPAQFMRRYDDDFAIESTTFVKEFFGGVKNLYEDAVVDPKPSPAINMVRAGRLWLGDSKQTPRSRVGAKTDFVDAVTMGRRHDSGKGRWELARIPTKEIYDRFIDYSQRAEAAASEFIDLRRHDFYDGNHPTCVAALHILDLDLSAVERELIRDINPRIAIYLAVKHSETMRGFHNLMANYEKARHGVFHAVLWSYGQGSPGRAAYLTRSLSEKWCAKFTGPTFSRGEVQTALRHLYNAIKPLVG